ncbi:DUF6531 domain-containing protein [Streptomyces sp. BA2]|uniref:DUF6531 domain-containing protein n=1 Tax=Streptomyces sp. BA2 TaxID=436595 RepID=UPI001324D92B|nr:DUF6531 domain-containing protein [Streptomyces sp. BA2]MWA13708.1 hypothetical protein [Streptomyces sp. BA2]
MAGNRPADWHVLDLDKDPTPGDPDRVRNLAKNLHDFADDVSKVLRDIKGMAGEDAILTWAGKTAESFTAEFEDAPGKLKKLKKSYEMAGDALSTYWPELERAQALADKALVKGREAQGDLSAAQTRLTSADSWMDKAGKEADKYKDDKDSGKDVPKPDPDKVKAATRNANSAEKAQTAAKSDVSSAKSNLDAAKKMAEDARKMREDAAGTAKKKLEEASDAGIQNRKWWEEVGDWVTDNWDTIVAVCKVVVAVLGIIAMIIGGPILGAIVLIAALVVLADTLNKYANGEAGLLDVAFAALDCIPGMKGLTSLRGLAKGMKGLKGGLKGLKSARSMLGRGKDAFGRSAKAVWKKLTDPVDLATGQMFLPQSDITLPGTLPLVFSRRVASDYRTGWWFGPTWSSTVDQRLEIDEEGVVFVTEDGLLLAYPHADGPGTATLPEVGPHWPLVRLDNGSYRIDDPLTGQSRYFGLPDEGLALLDRISDRNGNTINFDYDAEGTPLAIRHSGGYHLKFSVEEDRVTRLCLAGGAEDGSDITIKEYGYTDGNLTQTINSSGLPLKFAYDERLRVTSWTDSNHSRYNYSYDDQDRCIAEGGEAGHLALTLDYDGTDAAWPECQVTTLTTAEGVSSRFVINEQCQVIAEIDPNGSVTRSAYDVHHHLVSWTDAFGYTTEFTNNAYGQPITVSRPDGTEASTEYNELGLPLRVMTTDGAVWEHNYDERGNRTALIGPDGVTTRFTYDAAGRPLTVTDPLGASTRVRCNAAGLPVEIVSALGERATRSYDAFGRLIKVTDPVGATTRIWWTVEGRIARLLRADGAEETWEYDGEGNCVQHTNAAGASTMYEYTHFDLVRARTGPDGARHEFGHDASLRLTHVTNPHGLSWNYAYDAAGHLVAESDFDGRHTCYTRDAVGRLLERTNPQGQTVHFTYDAVGRPVTKEVDGRQTTFTYDRAGRLVRATGPDATLTWERDPRGRVLTERTDGRSLTCTYDAMGRRVQRTTPTGALARHAYDAVGRAIHLDTSGHALSFVYDAGGQEIERFVGSSLALTQTWDAAGRPIEQTTTAGGEAVQRRAYDYRPDSFVSRIDDPLLGEITMGLDPTGRITGVSGHDWTERYAYDEAGQLTAAEWPERHPGQEARGDREFNGIQLARAGAVHYEYDAAGRVVVRRKTRLSRKPDIWRYAWDGEDRLTCVTTPDGTVWRYLYDPLGRRTAKLRMAADGATVMERTDFTWDGPLLAEQTTRSPDLPHAVTLTWDYDGLRAITQTERLVDEATQENIDSRFFAIVTDLVGTPTELIGEDGDVAWRSRRTVWGLTTWPTRSAAYTPLRFPGQYHDPETGLHYNFQRHYDPESARYTTLDPLGLDPAPDPYGYVINPFRQIDPYGLSGYDTVTLYHGSQNWHGDAFSLPTAVRDVRQYTPDAGVYLTDDFMRAANQYAGPGGHIVRTEVPRADAQRWLRQHEGPAGNQPEYFVNTADDVDILNAGSPRVLPFNEAFMQNVAGNF